MCKIKETFIIFAFSIKATQRKTMHNYINEERNEKFKRKNQKYQEYHINSCYERKFINVFMFESKILKRRHVCL